MEKFNFSDIQSEIFFKAVSWVLKMQGALSFKSHNRDQKSQLKVNVRKHYRSNSFFKKIAQCYQQNITLFLQQRICFNMCQMLQKYLKKLFSLHGLQSARSSSITMFLLPTYTHAKQFSQLMLLTEKWFFHTNAPNHKIL